MTPGQIKRYHHNTDNIKNNDNYIYIYIYIYLYISVLVFRRKKWNITLVQ